MADLYHLLDELEEENDEENDHDNVVNKNRQSMETAATEPLSEEQDWEDDGVDVDNNTPGRRRTAQVPVALQEAEKLKHRTHTQDESTNMDDDDYYYDNDDFAAKELEGTRHEENKVYSKLHRHWMQERHCPELLKYDEEMVEEIKDQIQSRQEWIDQLLLPSDCTKSNSQEAVIDLMGTLAQVDLDRCKFCLSDWLSQRLAKIEAHSIHIAHDEHAVDSLSDAELAYLKAYGSLMEDHLRQLVLDHIPEAWQQLDEEKMIDRPNLDSYHFWMVKDKNKKHREDDHGYNNDHDDDNDEEEDLTLNYAPGTFLIAKYKTMVDRMRSGKVDLQL